MSITEYGDIMINDYMDEWGRIKIDGLLEDGTIIFVPAIIVETIVAKEFPMLYYSQTPEELRSKVSGATIAHVTQDFPEAMLKKGKASELRSKWT